MPFSPEIIKNLNAPLDGKHVSERSQGNFTLSYVEGWHVIAEANRIFGHDGWNRDTVIMDLLSEAEREIRGAPGFGVTYFAKVRITVGEVTREGCGAGHGIDKSRGLAHESAIKEAETDATKRALMTFGWKFGLALYDKEKRYVV